MLGPSRTIHYSVTVACAWLALSAAVGAQAPTMSPDQQRALQILDVLAKVFPPGDVPAKGRSVGRHGAGYPLAQGIGGHPAKRQPATGRACRARGQPDRVTAHQRAAADAAATGCRCRSRRPRAESCVLPESSRRNGRAGGAECAHMAGGNHPVGVAAVAGDVHQCAACRIPGQEGRAVSAIQLADVSRASTGRVHHLGARSEECGATRSRTSREAWGSQGSHARRGSAGRAGFMSGDAV